MMVRRGYMIYAVDGVEVTLTLTLSTNGLSAISVHHFNHTINVFFVTNVAPHKCILKQNQWINGKQNDRN